MMLLALISSSTVHGTSCLVETSCCTPLRFRRGSGCFHCRCLALLNHMLGFLLLVWQLHWGRSTRLLGSWARMHNDAFRSSQEFVILFPSPFGSVFIHLQDKDCLSVSRYEARCVLKFEIVFFFLLQALPQLLGGFSDGVPHPCHGRD
jgi:hypothetical protein